MKTSGDRQHNAIVKMRLDTSGCPPYPPLLPQEGKSLAVFNCETGGCIAFRASCMPVPGQSHRKTDRRP